MRSKNAQLILACGHTPVDPKAVRAGSLVKVAGEAVSPPAAALIAAVASYAWADEPECAAAS